MKFADYVLLAVIAVCFVAAIIKIRRHGTCSCGSCSSCRSCGSCSSCASHGTCAKYREDKNKDRKS